MPRESFVWDKTARGGRGDLVPKRKIVSRETSAGPMVMRDLDPYRSMVDGSVIGGRKQHRDHLRAHGVIEVGNELNRGPKPRPQTTPDGLGQDIKRAFEQHGH